MNELQTKLKELQGKGWTLSALADELGVNVRTVQRWHEGTRYPQSSKAVLIALDAIGRKRNIPKKRRYPQGHHLQRKAKDKAESGE